MLMKLTVEPVPHTCMQDSLHARMRAREWDKLRRKVDKQQQKRCGICGKPRSKRKPLIVQEEWEYTDLSRRQQLKGLVGLCALCHLTKNIDQARREQVRGDLDMKSIQAHFCRVNAVAPEVFRTHVTEALHKLKVRNRQKHWTTDLGDYAHLVDGSSKQRASKQEAAAQPQRRHRRARPSLVRAASYRTEKHTDRVRRRQKKC